MAFVDTLGDSALPEVAADDRARFGYLPNFTRVLARRPAAYAAWRQLNGAIKGAMDERRYELVTLTAARRLRSSYCSLAHGKVLVDRFHTAGEVVDIVRGRAVLDPVDAAIVAFADKVASDATAVTREDVDRLREVGLSDDEVVDVALATAARCFFSTALDALGVEPDAVYADLEAPLREALTVGRPIATR